MSPENIERLWSKKPRPDQSSTTDGLLTPDVIPVDLFSYGDDKSNKMALDLNDSTARLNGHEILPQAGKTEDLAVKGNIILPKSAIRS